MNSSTSTDVREARLSVVDVELRIGAVQILKDLSFELAPGRTAGLIGPNGSGKSSLLNVISGYYRPTRGHASVGGTVIGNLRPDQVSALGVGRSFQSIGRMQELTVREYVALGLEPTWLGSKSASLFNWPTARRAERDARDNADTSIVDFGIGDYGDTALRHCPYGVRKIADLLRAAICKPSILLLDEPTSGVAASDRQAIADLIKRWRSESDLTIVLVDHDVSFVSGLADELIALSAGTIVDSGDPSHVLANPQVMASFVGSSCEGDSILAEQRDE